MIVLPFQRIITATRCPVLRGIFGRYLGEGMTHNTGTINIKSRNSRPVVSKTSPCAPDLLRVKRRIAPLDFREEGGPLDCRLRYTSAQSNRFFLLLLRVTARTATDSETSDTSAPETGNKSQGGDRSRLRDI